ncbi:hypothetical protein RS399_03685 [Bacillus inaquosorum]|uniref:hypothetical protein n=1 Tax=Bacillus inaquosorum TaxID=483913 RepID=UPI0028FC1172|nr:hypothetical protein [Bacillus inaquosorum]WNW25022.1 hypothetical protein RS399_03685 [Bacillus inaquosorum]
MNKKPVKSVRAGTLKEACERIQAAHDLGFVVEIFQFEKAKPNGVFTPNLFMIDLFMPVNEETE